jgi:hypothetical protein
VTPSYHKHAKCWRVQVPAAESETGKRVTEYFETKEEAEDFIAEHRKTGSIQLADLSVQEKHVLGLIRRSVGYTPEVLGMSGEPIRQIREPNQKALLQ